MVFRGANQFKIAYEMIRHPSLEAPSSYSIKLSYWKLLSYEQKRLLIPDNISVGLVGL